MKPHLTNNPAETKKLAFKLAHRLKGGEVIGLIGELGSGKTVFVQGLAQGLGIKETVNSPTFVLMKVYQLPTPNLPACADLPAGKADASADAKALADRQLPNNSQPPRLRRPARRRQGFGGQATPKQLIHLDCYRLNDSQELKDIGLEEYLGRKDAVVVIEWANKIRKILPKDALIVKFKEGGNENQRIIAFLDYYCKVCYHNNRA